MTTIHVISHTHWDREWYLTFQQFRLRLVHLIDKLLDILDEDPEFRHFMLDGQTIVLDDYLQVRPEKEAALREHIQAGRILVGPWHILSDMFLVSPEAQIRNLLQGARTARRFGPTMPIGYSPDPFGNHGQVPQMLRGFGLETACLWRGVADLPAELWWDSPDGSRVLLAYLRDGYGNGANLPVHNAELFRDQLVLRADKLAAHSAVADHLIMLGTDHMEPSPFTSSALSHADRTLPGRRVRHSTLPEYVARVREQVASSPDRLPVLTGELRDSSHSHLLPGVLSARMWIKQRNHASETLLEKWAEPFNVFAEAMTSHDWGSRDPDAVASDRIRDVAPVLRQAWRILMENHPHDSICGCSIDQVHEEMGPRFDQADQIGEEITRQSLQAIAAATDTASAAPEGAISSLVVFNPHSVGRTELVEVDLKLPDDVVAFELLDAAGQVILHEAAGGEREQLANVLLRPRELRDTIGAITEGRVQGAAITSVAVTREGGTVTIRAVLDDGGHPNLADWKQAELDIAGYESDPTVELFHVLAHSPTSSRIRFAVPEVPALGWSTIWIRRLPEPTAGPAMQVPGPLRPLMPLVLPLAMKVSRSGPGSAVLGWLDRPEDARPPYRIENDMFTVEVVGTDGSLTVTDKRTGAVYGGLHCFVDGGDAGDEYNYCPPEVDELRTAKLVAVRAFRDALVPALELRYELRVPESLAADRAGRSRAQVTLPITSRVSLTRSVARIDVRTVIDNRARDHRLRVHFPAPVRVEAADHDGHFEVVRRPVGVPEKGAHWIEDPRPEVPQRAFTDVSDGRIGLAIANRGLPEVEVIRGRGDATTEIALTLLRCVGWLSRDDMPVRQGHAGPAFETPGAQMLGEWAFDYAIIPHAAGWQQARDEAYAFQAGLRTAQTGLHAGELPAAGSFLATEPASFVLSAVKHAEDGSGWIARGYNTSADPITVTLVPLRRVASAVRVNLAEEETEVLPVARSGAVTLPVGGRQIVTVRFRGPSTGGAGSSPRATARPAR